MQALRFACLRSHDRGRGAGRDGRGWTRTRRRGPGPPTPPPPSRGPRAGSPDRGRYGRWPDPPTAAARPPREVTANHCLKQNRRRPPPGNRPASACPPRDVRPRAPRPFRRLSRSPHGRHQSDGTGRRHCLARVDDAAAAYLWPRSPFCGRDASVPGLPAASSTAAARTYPSRPGGLDHRTRPYARPGNPRGLPCPLPRARPWQWRTPRVRPVTRDAARRSRGRGARDVGRERGGGQASPLMPSMFC